MTDNLHGLSLKDYSLIILLVSLAITFAIVGVGFIIAIANNPTSITFTGSFDLSQFTGILIGISMLAATLVAQQLTAKQQQAAIKANDQSWIDSDPNLKK